MSSCKNCTNNCSVNEEIKNNSTYYTIALAGNPNTGKSTVFNALTGLRQHTGNWPGKTVSTARGTYRHKGENFHLVDLPGTYSLLANSTDEEIARDFICFGNPDATIVVLDATSLERNLNLVLQVLEITDKVVVCLNLIDEAKRKGISIDVPLLEKELGVPVVPTVARSGRGLKDLMDKVHDVATNKVVNKPYKIRYDEELEQLIKEVEPKVENILKGKQNARWVALRLIEGNQNLLNSLLNFAN